MIIDTKYLERCITTLDKAYKLFKETEKESIDSDMYRSACIKEFEIIVEQSGKLLRKMIKPFLPSSREADKLVFKDIFRQAVLRSLISDEECERWLIYRDNRNNTAHDYGVNFAQETLELIPQFIIDAYSLADLINSNNNNPNVD